MSALADIARRADPELAAHALADPPAGEFEGAVADPDRGWVLEAVREGHLMHYGRPRAFSPDLDEDLRLLAGDALYALGLSRLADRGDLEAVAELADLISACARAHLEGREELVEELWAATAAALDGSSAGAREALAGRLAPAR